MRSYCNVILSLILVVFLFSGCKGGKEQSNSPAPLPSPTVSPLYSGVKTDLPHVDNIFTLNYKAEAGLNPYSCTDKDNLLLCQLIFEPLFQVREDFSYEPVLVESYSGDGVNFQFRIKTGITFQDGNEISIWDAMARESLRYGSRLKCIKNVWVENGSLIVSLNQTIADFPVLLDIPVIRDGAGYTDRPAGTGPYLLAELGAAVFLKAYDGYRDYDRLPINRIYLKDYTAEEIASAYEEAFVDLAVIDPFEKNEPQLGGNSELRRLDTTVMHYLGVNGNSEFFSSYNRRRLISSMLDRAALADKYIGGAEALLPVSPASKYYFNDIAQGSIYKDLPAALIENLTEDYDADGQLEYIQDGEIKEFSLTLIVCREDPAKLLTARAIAKQLGSCGITINLKELTENQFFDALYLGEYDLYYAEMRLKADFDLSELLSYGGSASYGLSDGSISGKIRSFLAASGEEKLEPARELYTYIASTCPLMPIAFEQLELYTHRGAVTGLQPTAANVFYNITEWKVSLR